MQKLANRPVFNAECPPEFNTPELREAWKQAASNSGSDSWNPEKMGDSIYGKLMSAEERKTKYGPTRVLVLQTKDGPKQVWCKTVLSKLYDEMSPKIGDVLVIIYKGSVPTGKGRPANLFGMQIVAAKKTRAK